MFASRGRHPKNEKIATNTRFFIKTMRSSAAERDGEATDRLIFLDRKTLT